MKITSNLVPGIGIFLGAMFVSWSALVSNILFSGLIDNCPTIRENTAVVGGGWIPAGASPQTHPWLGLLVYGLILVIGSLALGLIKYRGRRYVTIASGALIAAAIIVFFVYSQTSIPTKCLFMG